LASFLQEVGRGEEALEQIERALDEEPDFLAARLMRTRLLLERGEITRAGKEWDRVQQLRRILATYRPDSPYAADITRDSPALDRLLEEKSRRT